MNRFHLKLGLAFLLFAVGAALADDPAVERFGDLTYDRDRWVVTKVNNGYWVTAKVPDKDDTSFSTITITAAVDDVCRAGDFPERRSGYYGRTHFNTLKRPGFDVHVALYDIGCRNWRPPTVKACATYKDKTYRFSAPVTGCRGGPPSGDGFVGFLNTLSAAD